MNRTFFICELIVALILIGILALFLSPPEALTMPKSIEQMAPIGLVVIFLIFAGMMWKETAHDEREYYHRQQAGRLSFLVGSAILVAGIVIQSLDYSIDSWLVFALAGMVLTKIVSRIYSQLRQ